MVRRRSRPVSDDPSSDIHPGAGKLFMAMIGPLLLHGSLAACADSALALEKGLSASFICEGGSLFRVRFFDGQVRITTRSGAYNLDRRPSSIGQKYSSGDTTFILDEERAVLTGAGGGPFKRCHAT
jgi:hypothetical protein